MSIDKMNKKFILPKYRQQLMAKSTAELRFVKQHIKSDFAPFSKDEAALYEIEPVVLFGSANREQPSNTRRFIEKEDENGKYFINPNAKQVDEATIMCVGDLMGEPKMQAASFFEDSFNFRGHFEYVKDIFESSDMTIGNLETTVCEHAPYALEAHRINDKFHCNAPIEYLDAIKYGGIDMLATANNHSLDCGINGVKETLFHIKKYGFGSTGTFVPENKKKHLMVDINGIKVAILSYTTFSSNTSKLTELGKGAFINIFDANKAKQAIDVAKKDGAEFVLFYIHWGFGTSYQHEVGKVPLKQAPMIAEAGADYIVGSHPHCLQKYDRVKTADGRVVPVAYSIGNFITSDSAKVAKDNIILTIKIKKENGKVRIIDENYIPCHVFNNYLGASYVAVPAISKLNGGAESEVFSSVCDRAKAVLGNKIKMYGDE